MLSVAADRVDMPKALKDNTLRNGSGGFSRTGDEPGIFSPSGVWRDATMASHEKGRLIVKAMVDGIISDIQ
jgi:creatinine amidohydrolase/Fe(II)-dependent formamide hydrolase-like protein